MSSGVARAQKRWTMTGSSASRISKMLRTKSSSTTRTRAPWLGLATTNPSPCSRHSASRTGLALTP